MKSLFPLSIAVVLLSIAGLSLSGCMKSSSSTEQANPSSPKSLREVTLEKIDGQGLAKAIEQHRGKVVLIDFWATWCGPCKELFPHTVALRDRFSADDLAVITVSMDKLEQRNLVLEFLRRQQANTENYQSSVESDTEAFTTFSIEEGLPLERIYDRSGKTFRTVNGNHPAEIERAVIEAMRTSKAG